jgi:hypothetical protein
MCIKVLRETSISKVTVEAGNFSAVLNSCLSTHTGRVNREKEERRLRSSRDRTQEVPK